MSFLVCQTKPNPLLKPSARELDLPKERKPSAELLSRAISASAVDQQQSVTAPATVAEGAAGETEGSLGAAATKLLGELFNSPSRRASDTAEGMASTPAPVVVSSAVASLKFSSPANKVCEEKMINMNSFISDSNLLLIFFLTFAASDSSHSIQVRRRECLCRRHLIVLHSLANNNNYSCNVIILRRPSHNWDRDWLPNLLQRCFLIAVNAITRQTPICFGKTVGGNLPK